MESAQVKQTQLCNAPGCLREQAAIGLCNGHRWQKRKGLPFGPLQPFCPRRPKGSPPKIEYDEAPCPRSDLDGPCFIFRGRKNEDGYGMVHANKKSVSVHKYVWERDNGPVPNGLEIDHQCRVRACCNTNHLRVVTHKVNVTENYVRVSANSRKTHCPQGHEYTVENTRWKFRNGWKMRDCRKCDADTQRERKRRAKIAKCGISSPAQAEMAARDDSPAPSPPK